MKLKWVPPLDCEKESAETRQQWLEQCQTRIDWQKQQGLAAAVLQHAETLQVLMLGYMDFQALTETVRTRQVHFYSRSRQTLWRKGETSGNVLIPKRLSLDCDGDTLLIQAVPQGPTCHLGFRSCFTDESSPPDGNLSELGIGFLPYLEDVIRHRTEHPEEGKSYVQFLQQKGPLYTAQKLGEEGVETVIASLCQSREALAAEAADLLFHLLVLLRQKHLSLSDVTAVLSERHEKTQREREIPAQ